MRVFGLREHVKLLFHQIYKDLVLFNIGALDSFYSAFNACQRIDTLMHFTERSFAENTAQFILVLDILRFLETFETSEN